MITNVYIARVELLMGPTASLTSNVALKGSVLTFGCAAHVFAQLTIIVSNRTAVQYDLTIQNIVSNISASHVRGVQPGAHFVMSMWNSVQKDHALKCVRLPQFTARIMSSVRKEAVSLIDQPTQISVNSTSVNYASLEQPGAHFVMSMCKNSACGVVVTMLANLVQRPVPATQVARASWLRYQLQTFGKKLRRQRLVFMKWKWQGAWFVLPTLLCPLDFLEPPLSKLDRLRRTPVSRSWWT